MQQNMAFPNGLQDFEYPPISPRLCAKYCGAYMQQNMPSSKTNPMHITCTMCITCTHTQACAARTEAEFETALTTMSVT